jgi:hypothetical protein
MRFKEFLVENAHRTATKNANYPPQWDTHGVQEMDQPLVGHIATAADFLVWLELKPVNFKWTNYEEIFGKDEGPGLSGTKTKLVQQIRKKVHVIKPS